MNCSGLVNTDDGIRGCRKKAKYFGLFAGPGMCFEHAEEFARKFGLEEFHLKDRIELATRIETKTGSAR